MEWGKRPTLSQLSRASFTVDTDESSIMFCEPEALRSLPHALGLVQSTHSPNVYWGPGLCAMLDAESSFAVIGQAFYEPGERSHAWRDPWYLHTCGFTLGANVPLSEIEDVVDTWDANVADERYPAFTLDHLSPGYAPLTLREAVETVRRSFPLTHDTIERYEAHEIFQVEYQSSIAEDAGESLVASYVSEGPMLPSHKLSWSRGAFRS